MFKVFRKKTAEEWLRQDLNAIEKISNHLSASWHEFRKNTGKVWKKKDFISETLKAGVYCAGPIILASVGRLTIPQALIVSALLISSTWMVRTFENQTGIHFFLFSMAFQFGVIGSGPIAMYLTGTITSDQAYIITILLTSISLGPKIIQRRDAQKAGEDFYQIIFMFQDVIGSLRVENPRDAASFLNSCTSVIDVVARKILGESLGKTRTSISIFSSADYKRLRTVSRSKSAKNCADTNFEASYIFGHLAAAEGDEPRVVDDVNKYIYNNSHLSSSPHTYRSMLLLPIYSSEKSRPFGFIAIESSRPYAFTSWRSVHLVVALEPMFSSIMKSIGSEPN